MDASSQRIRSRHMNIGKWVIGGLVGGRIGAGIWAGIVYATHRQIGWIAWGVGALVGVGVRLAAGEEYGPKPGVTAAVIAILALIAGKFAAVYLIVSSLGLGEVKVSVTAESMIA